MTITNRNFFEDLKDMLKANYPLIYLTTSEYDRTQQYVRNISKRNDFIFINWDSVSGLREFFTNSIRLIKIILLYSILFTERYL